LRSWLVLLMLPALFQLSACAGSAAAPIHQWRLSAERDPKGAQSPVEDHVPFSPIIGHRNEAAGPRGERLVVRTNRGFFPRVFLEDADSSARALIPEGWSYLPGWSPNGRVMTCVHEDTASHVQELVLVDRATGNIRRFQQTASVIDYRWAPDARSLAFYGVDRGTRKVTLYWLEFPSGAATAVDTLELVADYDFTWSPRSDLLVFVRPTATTEMEDVAASELWLAERGGAKFRLTSTPDRVELEPHFVGDRTLMMTVAAARGEKIGARREVVVDVIDAAALGSSAPARKKGS